MANTPEHHDVVIVGAGVHGLCAAHTFLSIDPSLSLLVVDSKSSVGGVWAKEQLYPGLCANGLQGYYEFTDFPILEVNVGVSERGPLSGEALNAYLYKYAEHFDLLRRTRFNTTVLCATNNEEHAIKAWTLELTSIDTAASEPKSVHVVTCARLVVATGQASQPLFPTLPGKSSFTKPIIHSVNLAQASKSLLPDPTVTHITILGAGKSAHDAVYLFTMAGKRITWIFRRSGRGGFPMGKSHTQMGPWKVWIEGLLMMRCLSWFGACPWSDGDGFGWIRWMLQKTMVGRWLVRGYFANMSKSMIEESDILRDEKTKVLVPDETMMWYGTQANGLTFETNFYEELVNRGEQVEIIREDVKRLDDETVVLEDGRKIKTDAIVCATGYQYGPSFELEPSSKLSAWGVPVQQSHNDVFLSLEERADVELLQRFPILSTSPASLEKQPGLTPWRLWRFIAPLSQVCSGPGKRSLAFLSTFNSYQTMVVCELTSLWAYAYLHDELSVNPGTEADIMYEATLWSRFGKWKTPMGKQGKAADFLLDSLPYYDLLLRDLGLRSWRKSWGLLGEIFGGRYKTEDYRGIVDEWKMVRQGSWKKKKEA